MGDVGDEPVEVVGDDGAVLGVVTRATMRAANLRHRSVGIVVRRSGDGDVLAHRRAAWKDLWPGRWDLAFGGVCGVTEDETGAARRELAEEAGVAVDAGQLRHLGTAAYADESVSAVGTLFELDHGGPFTFADGEVEATEWVPVDQLGRWLAAHPHCPDTVHLLRTIGWRWPDEP